MVIPWFTLPPIDLEAVGLGKIYWFSLFVIAGIVLGVMFLDRICLRGGDIEVRVARLMPEASVIGGFIGAHLVHVLFYHPELMDEDPWILVKFWAGISSVGGFLGGAIGAIAVLKYYKQKLLPYGDRIVLALGIGWIFGRLGCATSHDHPGSLTDFFLAIQFPDGARHDLGLYEFLLTLLVLVPALLLIARRPWRTGTLLGTALVIYTPARFFLDFLRATDREFVDARHLGLTFAQYGTLAMFVAGVAVLVLAVVKQLPVQPPLWGSLAPPLPERGPRKRR